MMDVCLLGTGGMMPLPYRWLTSLMIRCEGSHLLIDCGEGTQIAIREKGWTFKPIDVICITHYHADHISGLPGILLTMGNAERTEPLTVIGPRGLERVVNSLRVIAPELPFPIRFLELTQAVQEIPFAPYQITAFRVNHNIPCYGYTVELKRAGRFQVDRAKELDIPLRFWNPLQRGNVVEENGRVYTPDMVMGPPRKGLKVTYVTDTRPTSEIVRQASGADLFICEGMYGEPDKVEKAKEHKHMTYSEAASLAQAAAPKEMWLTHFSPALNYPEDFIDTARKIFPRSLAAKDGYTAQLRFEEDE